MFNSDLLAKSDGEPVGNLSHRHKADPKAKSTKAAKAGDEIQPGHLRQPLVLWDVITRATDICGLTICSRFSKEDVYKGNVLLISVVIGLILKRSLHLRSSVGA